ncbi:hypothetical protein P170DRAFT_456945 [Aspergillus steynii IBT 23096]|uniref:EGF domain-specific O-linked N-acetylglucosamine transferase n=1 Tax=Aspergillus steynii IBT 23096 TaxID=1392250 RepID=A0A2I2G6D2_9EURO|nr:uncharacterized protein P170DRAFT_456945 [Aspergillus steynii IBT 23096]PLB48437.1 hypothetical protein P170DRAFT_456945 [Aspergillus steynii IBT 23096]
MTMAVYNTVLRRWPSLIFLDPQEDSPEELAPLDLPSEYSETPDETTFCAERFSPKYLEDLRDSSTEYCTTNSTSQMTCFHSTTTPDRVDTFCLGRDVLYDASSKKFHLESYGEFHDYWYRTGPSTVIYNWVDVQNTTLNSTKPINETDFTILVKREGSHNLWHSMMELFSMTMTMDVLQMSRAENETQPFWTPSDAKNTQVVLLDDNDDGPYIDLWSLFAEKPTVRLTDLPESSTLENIIVPLAGGSNPLWQGDWEIHPCEDSRLLRTFSRRVLDSYGIGDSAPRQGPEITLTFINRTDTRQLVHDTSYLEEVEAKYPHVKVQSIDFAAIPFKDQLRIIQETDILVGVHGAGLTHGMFLPVRSTMVEILPSALNHKGFRNVAGLLDHSYFSIHASTKQSARKRNDWHGDDVFLEKDRFMKIIDVAIKGMYNRGERNYDVK